MKNYIFLGISLAILATSLSACYTVRGVGEDVEAAGETIQRGATGVQRAVSPGYY